MNRELEFTVSSYGERLDKYIAEQCRISRSYAQKLIDEGQVTINDRAAKSSQKLNAGDKVAVSMPPPSPISLAPEDMPLKIVTGHIHVTVTRQKQAFGVTGATTLASGATITRAAAAGIAQTSGLTAGSGVKSWREVVSPGRWGGSPPGRRSSGSSPAIRP